MFPHRRFLRIDTDLAREGGIYQHELVLSDPVILSRTGDYGVTDLGRDGISSFFSQHDCNQYCRPKCEARQSAAALQPGPRHDYAPPHRANRRVSSQRHP